MVFFIIKTCDKGGLLNMRNFLWKPFRLLLCKISLKFSSIKSGRFEHIRRCMVEKYYHWVLKRTFAISLIINCFKVINIFNCKPDKKVAKRYILNSEYITVNNARKYGTPLSLRDRIMKHGFPEGINFHPDYEYFNLKDR